MRLITRSKVCVRLSVDKTPSPCLALRCLCFCLQIAEAFVTIGPGWVLLSVPRLFFFTSISDSFQVNNVFHVEAETEASDSI